jgi:hypothetical protein
MALALFQEAESRQVERKSLHPLLYSMAGFRYCDLLLGPAEREAATSSTSHRTPIGVQRCIEVERRVEGTLEWAIQSLGLLAVALDRLTLSRARIYRAILEEEIDKVSELIRRELDQAVRGLRDAGQVQYIPLGLLTRAWMCCIEKRFEEARADLEEAREIADRGSMKLHLADIALSRARLFRDVDAFAEAKRLVAECGYGRRLPEITDLEEIFTSGRLLPWHADFLST